MMEITITRALSELKLLDSRINRAINDSHFVSYSVGGKVPTGFKSVKEIEEKVKSSLQSINDLIARRNKIKSLIVESNAETTIRVADKRMTVAEAIERKTSIQYEQDLLIKLKREYANIVTVIERIKRENEIRLDRQLQEILGSDDKNNVEKSKPFIDTFEEQFGVKMIDPIELSKKIQELEESIEDFLSNVDFVLSESNSTTKILLED